MIRQHTETENFERIYECKACSAIQEEHKLVKIKLDGYFVQRCFVCNSEQVKQIWRM